MSDRDSNPRRLRLTPPQLAWLGWGCLVLGILLIAFYATTRFRAHQSRSADVQRFEQELQPPELERPEKNPPAPGSAFVIPDGPVDQTLWSSQRIEAYQQTETEDHGPPLAVLRIPAVDIIVPVHDGTDEWALTRGAGRVPGTARPGEAGNLALAGHRDGFFRGLKDIQLEDTLELQTRAGLETYAVRDISIVDPSDVSVLYPTENPSVTLVTCYPFYFVGSAPKRFIVRAERVPQEGVEARRTAAAYGQRP